MGDGRLQPDEEHLPWLEAVDDEDRAGGVSARRMIVWLVVVAVVVAGLAAALFLLGRQGGGPLGPPELIRAEPGPFKVRPDRPGGLDVAGDSGTAYATSAGEDGDAAIDLDALPEEPIERAPPAQPPAPPAPTPAQTPAQTPAAPEPRRIPPGEVREPVEEQAPAPPQTRAGGGTVIQLGAFSSAARAEAAWEALAGRFSLLRAMGKSIVPVSGGGATLYRLRASAPSPAEALRACRTLKVAGENCVVID